jgi:hypothetical protein
VAAAPGNPVELELSVDALQHHEAVGLWYAGNVSRVRAHVRDRDTEPDS